MQHCSKSSCYSQANGLEKHQNRMIEDCIRKYADESQNWLKVLDGILFSVHIAKHCSSKYSPFYTMYKMNLVDIFSIS